MISDIRDIISDLKEILLHDKKVVSIVTLLCIVVFLSFTVFTQHKQCVDEKFKMDAKCDSLIALQDKFLHQIEADYNKKLLELHENNKSQIVSYYQTVIQTFTMISDKQKKILNR